MRRKSSLPLPRYVDQASVQVGDTIKVSWKTGDIEHTRTGIVGGIFTTGGVKTFHTELGNTIVEWSRFAPVKPRFTLLEEAKPSTMEPLFEMIGESLELPV